MISQDVIHAFYIPAFRVQYHVVPGRYAQMWFTATKPGSYHLFCGMYCGTQHSEMGGRVVALEPKEFAEWLANKGSAKKNMTPVQAGMKLFNKIGCANCHGEAKSIRAPSLVGVYGKARQFSNHAPLVADEDYLRESILRPYNKLVSGYGKAMPPYEGQLSEEDVMNLVAYLKAGTAGQVNASTSAIANSSSGMRTSTGDISGDNKGLQVGALQFNEERNAPTPTTNEKRLAVGAIAAELKSDGEAR
jgi:cytochrome c oxidase subunit II